MEDQRVRQQQESKQRNREARQKAFDEHQQVVEAIRQASAQTSDTDRTQAVVGALQAERRALSACVARRSQSLQCANDALLISMKRKAENEARQVREDEMLETRAQEHRNALVAQEQQFHDSLRQQQAARQERANRIASTIGPTPKEMDVQHREAVTLPPPPVLSELHSRDHRTASSNNQTKRFLRSDDMRSSVENKKNKSSVRRHCLKDGGVSNKIVAIVTTIFVRCER